VWKSKPGIHFQWTTVFRHFRRAILIFLHGNDSDFPSVFREILQPKENRNFTSTNRKQSKLSDVAICLAKKKKKKMSELF